MKKLFFIGSIYPSGIIENLLELGSKVDFPSHNFQDALIRGFSKNVDEIMVISALKTSTFPRINKLFFRDRWDVDYGVQGESVMIGRINLPLINLFYKYIRAKKILRKVLSHEEDNYVVIYGVHTPFLKALYDLQSNYSIKSCLIIPDLPEYMSTKQNKLYRIMKKIDSRIIQRSLSKISCFAPLSPWMKEKLMFGNKPWVQVEGVYDDTVEYEEEPKSNNKTILYTGKVDERYGIKDLIDAFLLIKDSNYELWIRGNGELESFIKQKAMEDSRIKLISSMTKKELVRLQKKATLLVNPLHGKELFTRYFFPSKTLEYMGSGTPTLMCRLACMPKEYDEYLFYFNDESVRGMSDRIKEICEMPDSDLKLFGLNARNFVLKNKNGKIQSKKILMLLESV